MTEFKRETGNTGNLFFVNVSIFVLKKRIMKNDHVKMTEFKKRDWQQEVQIQIQNLEE